MNPPVFKSPVAHRVKRLNNQSPKIHHLRFLKNHKHKKPTNNLAQSLLLPNLQIDVVLLDTPPFYPTISNPIPYYQSQTQIHQTQAQQQHQIYTLTLSPYSGFLANTTLQLPTIIPAPPLAPQPELINYSNLPKFSTQPINFANTDKTSSSELPQPIHTFSNIHDTLQDISPISDTSISDPLSSQFSLPTASQIASNLFNQCIGKQPDTTRTYPTLLLKLDPKFFVPLSSILRSK